MTDEWLPRSRRRDPSTSHAAGREYERQTIRPDSPRHQALQAYEFIPDGLTGPELEEEVGGGLDHKETCRKRINELERMRLVKKTGVQRPNLRSARRSMCNVYIITDLGLRALRRLDAGKTWPPPGFILPPPQRSKKPRRPDGDSPVQRDQ